MLFTLYLLVAAVLAWTLLMLGTSSWPGPFKDYPLVMPVAIVLWPLWGLFLFLRWGSRKWAAVPRE